MKKLIMIISLLIVNITISKLYACDQCGCSIAGSYNNITGYAQNNYVMLKSSYYQFSNIGADDPTRSAMFELALFGGYTITNRLHLLAFVPYKQHVFHNQNETPPYKTNGLGDATLLSNYTLFTNADNVMSKFTQTLSLKAGIELPTGRFIEDYRVLKVPAMISTGSGTVDWHTGLRYVYKQKNTTLISDYAFKWNATNNIEYQFGQQHALSIIAAQRFMQTNFVITPYLGLTAEVDAIDKYHTIPQHGTDGETLMVNAGLECGFNNYIIGVNADVPAFSSLQEGTRSSPRMSLRLAYMLNK